MSTRRPDVSDEDLGIRTFQLRKAKAVERAMERVRHTHKDDWKNLDGQDITDFEWILGELWAYVNRDAWEDLRFGKITMHEIRTVLTYGRELKKHARTSVDVLNDVVAAIPNKE